MQSRNTPFTFDATYNFGTDTPLVAKNDDFAGSGPPANAFLLLDGTPMLLLDNTYLLLL